MAFGGEDFVRDVCIRGDEVQALVIVGGGNHTCPKQANMEHPDEFKQLRTEMETLSALALEGQTRTIAVACGCAEGVQS